ncbi:BSD [Musa troglodytarum]|uniref:Prolyl endopeptidase-like n=1 Tax=Musa troglodytarum TaxID=320322 RepID=A0A9E7H1W4_9LILI|nr:BSD [Musa troglodytarum]
MDLWQRAKGFAEEAAKRSQEISKEAAKRSQELTKGAAKFSQEFVSETAKKSKEIASEAAKKADLLRSEALRAAEQIKTLTVDLPIPMPSTVGQASNAAVVPEPGSDLERFGVTEELREFVKGITISTFRDFPMQDEPETSDVPTVSNVRQDLNEWQARHATLVLSTVKEISNFRYELCPRYMKERKFWRIYFILVDSHVAPFEKQYMEELKKKEEQKQIDSVKENPTALPPTAPDAKETELPKSSTSLTAEDLDAFLLGDLGSDDEGLDDGKDGLDDDFDKIGSTSILPLFDAYAAMLRGRAILSSPFPFLSSLFFSASASSASYSFCKRKPPYHPSLKPPVAKKIPFTCSAHGRTWEDPYRWMSDTGDPDLVDYLGRENAYADSFMADTFDIRRSLVGEMKSRMPDKVSTPPEHWGPWSYYQYIPEGREYPVLCRRLRHPDGYAKALLNYMRGCYVHIGTCRISLDHKFLAYTLDISGNESFTLQVKDLHSGHVIPNSKVEGVVSLAWAGDSSCLLVFSMELGSGLEDHLLFTEKDMSCCMDITSTKDGKFITINSNSRTSSEEDTENMKDGLWLVRERVAGVQYFLEHHYGFFYILTNAPLESTSSAAEGYYLARCIAEKSLTAEWQVIVLPGQDVSFQDMDIFHGHLVLSIQQKGLPLFCSIDIPMSVNSEQPIKLENLNPWFFPVPSCLCSIVAGSNHDFMSSIYRVMPDIIVDYDMGKREFTILHQEEVVGLTEKGESDSYGVAFPFIFTITKSKKDESLEDGQQQSWTDLSEAFSCERIEVVSHDGFMVPLTIVRPQKAKHTNQSPGLLHGYGAYGEVLDKSWCSDHICLLSRGWVLAYADVRGGGGEGSLHQSGTRACKMNSIYDFTACGMYLVNEGFVHKNKLAAIGCSAGGLLVAAAINIYHSLFSAVILKVPFLDICNTMLNPCLPLTILDYDEFGDPRNQADFEIIHHYSPFDNITQGCYPSVLVTASFHDSRVGVWEAAKWVAQVREKTCPTCSQSVILKTNMSGGHFGEGGRYIHCEDVAFEYAFLIKAMGMLDDEKQSHYYQMDSFGKKC